MKSIELNPDWFSQCPRYLSAKRFGAMTGLSDHQERVESLIDQGVIPTRRIGRHLMVDMHRLMLMLPSHKLNEAFVE